MIATSPPTTDRWNLGPEASELLKLIGFEPTGEEQARILRCRKRFKLDVGGVQAGKSMVSSADFILHFVEDLAIFRGEPLLYWLVSADYERTKAEFGYIAGFLSRLGFDVGDSLDLSKVVNPGKIEVRPKDDEGKAFGPPVCRIETKSGKDPRTLSSFAINGIIGCEASQLDLDTYQKCLERIAPKRGWLTLAGSYEGALGWYPSLAKAWEFGSTDEQSFKLPSPTNYHFYPGGMDDPELLRLKRTTSDTFFAERIMGIAAPPTGMVFSEFRPDVHIRDLEYDPDLPVIICDDPGYGHAHAIEILQVQQGQVCVVDEIYERGITTTDLIDVCMKRPWWKGSKTLVIDPHYANQHAAERSIAEVWLAKTGLVTVGVKVKIAAGTERLKTYLKVDALTGRPGIVFNGKLDMNGKPTCKGVLSELGAYPNPFDNQTHVYSNKLDSEGNVVGDEPADKYNDGCKAIIYGLVAEFGLSNTSEESEFITQPYARIGMESRRRYQNGRETFTSARDTT